jgi:lysyl-tRNA synthetase class 2
VRDQDDFETAFFKILLEKIEPALRAYSISVLCDYPASQAALAVVDGGVARRFEYFIGGVELSNAFLELGGRSANLERIEESLKRRRQLGLSTTPVDEDFLQSMDGDFTDCAGNALGMDRLQALLTGEADLDSIIPFRFGQQWRKHFIK